VVNKNKKGEGKMFNKKENWKALLVIIGLATMLLMAGCGGSDDAAAPAPAEDAADDPAEAPPAADVPEVDGERHETETVSMVIADGWDVMDIPGGLQAYKGNVAAIEVKVQGSGQSDDDAQARAEQVADSYDGTMIMELDLLGLTFYHTYFEYSGTEQSKMFAVRDGAIVEIGLTGPDHEDDEEIAGMLYSIIFN
jgi:hypothetical protein